MDTGIYLSILLIFLGLIMIVLNRYFLNYYLFLNQVFYKFMGINRKERKKMSGNQLIQVLFRILLYVTGLILLIAGIYSLF